MIESCAMPKKIKKVMRVYLFNTHENGAMERAATTTKKERLKILIGKKRSFECANDSVSKMSNNESGDNNSDRDDLNEDGTMKRWTFHLQARVVDETKEREQDATEIGAQQGVKFSHFLEKMKIEVFDDSVSSSSDNVANKEATVGDDDCDDDELGLGLASAQQRLQQRQGENRTHKGEEKNNNNHTSNKTGNHPEQEEQMPIKTVEWSRADCGIPRDGFTISMAGAKDTIRVRCTIVLRNDPPKFQLSGELADVIGKEEETAGRVIHAIWSRCKALELVSENDTSLVELDETLLRLCAKNALFEGKNLGDFVSFRSVCVACTSQTHMPKVCDPLVFEYKIRPYGPSPAHCDCYDVQVETLPPSANGPNSMVQKLSGSATNELEELEQRIFQDTNFIETARRRRAYLLSFSQDPQAFIDNCVNEYSESFKGVPRRKEAWAEAWTSDAAMRLLEKASNTNNNDAQQLGNY